MPNLFQKNFLASACAALATSTSVPAQAVNMSQTGQGQVLIFPYYTVRGGHDTYLSLLNSSDVPTLVTVRFWTSIDSVRASSFDLYLAPHDQWTGGITATVGGAKLISSDRSCTEPSIPHGGLLLGLNLPPDYSMDIVREGYLEVFEIGEIKDPAIIAGMSQAAGSPSCNLRPTPGFFAALDSPTGILSGTATLINVAGGAQYGYEPVALEHFSQPSDILWTGVTLAHSDHTSQVLDKGRVVTSTWERGIDAISAVLMHASMSNEFVLEPTTLSGTDWVVTMPTNVDYPSVAPPFAAGRCQFEFVGDATVRDREGRASKFNLPVESPLVAPAALCNNVSVLTFNNANLLASAHSENLGVSPDNGWAEFKFQGALVSREGHRYKGLPVIGFMVHDFVNGNVGGLLSNYGGNFAHKYTTVIDAP
ncbi:MAG: hypothetical protein ABWY06_23090 [Pseudomonas sp.]|uniref:hypothetical protein n=1 Tax=Pseudomonas sp. TaxID=306 RepID=UPI0033980CA9